MGIELQPAFEERLRELAEERSLTVEEFLEQLVARFADETGGDSIGWVRATQERLSRVWPIEDFSDWQPPNAG